MKKKLFLLLLDGSKGAGKTTVSELLQKQLPNLAYFGLDMERRALENQDGSRTERNQRAFDVILKKTEEAFDKGINVVIDCGLFEKRIAILETLAETKNADVFKVLLRASRDVQLDRVRARDTVRGKETDVERFDEIHKGIHSKTFTDFTVFDTETMRPEEIAKQIGELINSKS